MGRDGPFVLLTVNFFVWRKDLVQLFVHYQRFPFWLRPEAAIGPLRISWFLNHFSLESVGCFNCSRHHGGSGVRCHGLRFAHCCVVF